MKNMIYRIFTVTKVNGHDDVTVYGYQEGNKAQAALDSFLVQHSELSDLQLHCVLWNWDWK